MCWAFGVEMGMPVGWAKNWAGVRGRCSSCAFGMGEESWSPWPWLLVEQSLRGRIGQQQGWPFGHLSWIQEDCRGLRAKLFLFILLFPSLQVLVALCCCLFLSLPLPLVSNPKTSWGATQHLLFSSSTYKSPFFSGKPCTIVHAHAHTHNKLTSLLG